MGELTANSPVVFYSLFGYLLVHILLDGRLWAEGIILTLSSGLAVPFGVVFGMPAAVGLAAGVVAKDSLRMVLSTETLLYSCSLFVLSYVGSMAWQHGFRPPVGVGVTQPRWWLGFAGVVGVGSATGAAFLAWGSELLGVAPFYLAFGRSLVTVLAATVLLTPLIVFPVARSRLSERFLSVSGSTPDSSPLMRRRVRIALGVVPLLWAVGGLVWSLGFQLRQRMPLAGFQRVDLEFLYYWLHPALFGQGGRRAQVVFGAIMLTLLVVVLRQSTHDHHD